MKYDQYPCKEQGKPPHYKAPPQIEPIGSEIRQFECVCPTLYC